MSNYFTKAKRPRQKNYSGKIEWEDVAMLDNYYGAHEYGVKFPDGKVYPKEKCKIKK
ncbi:MAG: hypothetical protein ACOCQ4_01710 [bacterium]